MLYINANEEKRMIFEVDVHGIDSKELHGFVRFNLYGYEVGFPAEIEHKKITALIPPLLEVIEKEIEDGTVIEGKLELFTDRHYFKPWEGEIKVGAPMGVKAKLTGESSGPKIKTRLVNKESVEEPKVLTEEGSVTKEDIRSIIFDTLKNLTSKKNLTESDKKGSKKLQKRRSELKESSVPSNPKWTQENLRNITEDQIISYMERKGTKNQMVQEVILNKARTAAGSDDNFKIFREVVKTLRKPR